MTNYNPDVDATLSNTENRDNLEAIFLSIHYDIDKISRVITLLNDTHTNWQTYLQNLPTELRDVETQIYDDFVPEDEDNFLKTIDDGREALDMLNAKIEETRRHLALLGPPAQQPQPAHQQPLGPPAQQPQPAHQQPLGPPAQQP
uniref:Uncharacterized protein n=1 Tax=Acrobeloides nanus TaxID=290746 RepID=A0A914DE96_9BILA